MEQFSSLNATGDSGDTGGDITDADTGDTGGDITDTGGDITDTGGDITDTGEDTEPSPPVYDDDDKETLIDFVLSKKDSLSTRAYNYVGDSDGMRERCWALIELNVIRRITKILKKSGVTDTDAVKQQIQKLKSGSIAFKKRVISKSLKL